MSSTHLLAFLLLLLGAVNALEDDFQDIQNHFDILKGSESPPTRTPEEEAEHDRMLKDVLSSLGELTNARKENVDRANEIVQLMRDLSEKQRAQKVNELHQFKQYWKKATPPPSLFDKSLGRRRAGHETDRNNTPGAMKSTSEKPFNSESDGKVINGEKTTPVETRPVETTPRESEENVKFEATSVAVNNISENDFHSGENTEKHTTVDSSEESATTEKTTYENTTPEDNIQGKTTIGQIVVDDSQTTVHEKEATTEYFKEIASEETTTTDSETRGVTVEEDSFEDKSASSTESSPMDTKTTDKKTNAKHGIIFSGPRGGDSRKKRSLTNRIHGEMSTKSPEKHSGLKFLEKVEVQEPGKANKTVKYRLAAKPKWFGPGMSGYDSSKKTPGNKVRHLLNMEKLRTTNPEDVKNVGVQGARKTVNRETIHKRPPSEGSFGPRGGDSRKKRSLTIGIHSKKFAAQGPGLGKLLSDSTGDKRIFV